MRPYPCLFVAMLLCVLPCRAELWPSVTGEVLEGDFVRYQMRERKIVIRRDRDWRVFEIDETEFAHSARLRAVLLQNREVQPYWETDYDKAKKAPQNKDKLFLLLCRNGSDAEAFELLYHKLLLRKEFQQLLEGNGFVACVQETVPQGLRNQVSGDSPEAKEYRRWLNGNLPMVFYAVSPTTTTEGGADSGGWFRLRTEGNALREGDDFTPYRHIEERLRIYRQDRREAEAQVQTQMEEAYRNRAGGKQ